MTPAPDLLAPAADYSAHPVATIVLDPSGHIVGVNPAAEALLAIGNKALVGKPIGDIVPVLATRSFAPPRTIAAYDAAVTLAGRHHLIDVVGETGETGATILALLPASRGEPQAARRGATKAAAVGAATILAHEIKNPLSGIRGAAQLIASGKADRERFTSLICREVDRIAALIDRMEILSSERPMSLEAASVFPTIRHALDIARAGFASDVAIEERHDPSLPLAMFDADALVQLLLNLVKNAVEALAGTEGPRITVSASYRHGHFVAREDGEGMHELPIMLTVTDNGPGVPAQILSDLFRPFASGKSGGTGLGLAGAERLALGMGGTSAYDRDEAAGLTHFRLMIARAP